MFKILEAHHLCFAQYQGLGRSASFRFTVDSVQELDLFFLERTFGEGHCCSFGKLLRMLP